MRVSPWAQNFEAAARSLGVELDIVEADENNLDSAIAALAKNGAHGLVVTSDGVYVAHVVVSLKRGSNIGCPEYLRIANKLELVDC